MEGQISREDLANLERQVKNLTKLVEINSIVNSTLDIKKLLTVIMEIIKDIMETEASTLLLFDDERRELVFKVALGEAGEELTEKYRVAVGQGIAGWVAQNLKAIYVNEAYTDERFDPNFDKQTGFTTRSILCAPLLFKGRLLGVVQAINPVDRPGFDDNDMHLFQLFSEEAALAVQNAIFFQNALEEERIKSELASARAIQSSLIPDINHRSGPLTVAARSRYAREMGGDFHGLYTLDNGDMAVFLGDIHEKGVPGALRAAQVCGALNSMAGTRGRYPSEIVKSLARYVMSDGGAGRMFSLFYGVVDMARAELVFVNTGVGYPILIRDGVARYLRMGDVMSDPENSNQVRVRLREGDTFTVITDGLLDVRNRGGQKLGLKRIMAFLQGCGGTPSDLISELMNYAEKFCDGLGYREDVSVVAFRME